MAGAATKADDTKAEVIIQCRDDGVFELTYKEACVSEIWETALVTRARGVAQLPNPDITYETMQTVIEFCKQYASDGTLFIEKPLKSSLLRDNLRKEQEWYVSFVDDMDKDTLFVLFEVATKLKIEQLRELTCAKLASTLKDKTPEEIRDTYKIVNDFTPEEEENLREQNTWMEDI